MADKLEKRLKRLTEEEYQQHKRKAIRIYAYGNRIIWKLLPLMKENRGAIALFDNEGCLLKLFAPEETRKRFFEAGIERGTLWGKESSGYNAVAAGFESAAEQISYGSMHECAELKAYSIYFMPLKLTHSFEPFHLVATFGIAWITPNKQITPEERMVIHCIGDNIAYEYHAQQATYRHYDGTGFCALNLDINTKNQKIQIFHHSQNLFEMLELEPYEILYQPATALIDPEPKNTDLWSIIRELRRVQDYRITLSLRGKQIDCIISTDPYHAEEPGVKGTQVVITTPKRVSAQVSEKMSNGAVRTFDDIIGRSAAFKSSLQKARLLSGTDGNVMLLGESGVGKDIIAQAMHNASPRRQKPFVAVNCGALPRDLIASELFGYESGAFTGAKKQGNIGKFELANGGTIFLDEIGELPLDLQATLLRVVEQKQFMRLGGSRMIDIDVKIISATNVNISEMIAQNRFRADLYYRLGTMRIQIPPLRNRGEDVILLAEHFVEAISKRIQRNDIMKLSSEAKQLMLQLPWHGNVRELQNVFECIVQLYPENVIRPEHIYENIDQPAAYAPYTEQSGKTVWRNSAYIPQQKRGRLTKEEIEAALRHCDGNRSEAARYLGIARKTLYRNMERLGMEC